MLNPFRDIFYACKKKNGPKLPPPISSMCFRPFGGKKWPLIILVACSVANAVESKQPSPSSSAAPLPSDSCQDFISTIEQWKSDLIKAGWSESAAQTVIALNTVFWETTFDENPAAIQRQLALLKGLGKHPSLMNFIENHPHSSGLLSIVKDPELIAKSMSGSADECAIIEGMYVPHATPESAQGLGEALRNCSDVMTGLVKRGMPGYEVAFMFNRGDTAGIEYERWLRDVTTQKLHLSDAELTSFMVFVLTLGDEIRGRMNLNPDFLERFRGEIWPKLARISSRTESLLDRYIQDPRILDILALPEGEPLLERCGPEIPLNLLYGAPELDLSAYPQEFHEIIIQSLLRGDKNTVDALIKFRDEPLFKEFLKRDLAPDVRTAAVNKMLQSDTTYPNRIAYFNTLDAKALAAEVGPPPSGPITWVPGYDIVSLTTKMAQGREYSGLDVVLATVDVISFVPTVKAVSTAGKVGAKAASTQFIKKVGTESAEEVAEKQAKVEMTGYFEKVARERAALHLGKGAAEQLSTAQLIRYGTPGVLSDAAKATTLAIESGTTVDITKPIQYLFTHTNVSRTSLKRLTGLDARVFMRGDARVVIRFNKTIPGIAATTFMSETAVAMAVGAAAESEPGSTTIRTVMKKGVEAGDRFDDWQKNISAWWLMNASGMLDAPVDVAAQEKN